MLLRYGAMWFWAICGIFIILSFWGFHMKGWSETLLHDELAWG